MCAAADLGPHKCILCPEIGGIDSLEAVAPDIVVAVPRSAFQMRFSDVIFLHGLDHTELVVFGGLVDHVKAGPQLMQYGLRETKYVFRNSERGIAGRECCLLILCLCHF